MQLISCIFIPIFLLGCAAKGPLYQEHVVALQNVEASKSRVLVFRTGEYFQYSAIATSIAVDSQSVGICDFAGYQLFEVAPGTRVLSVDKWFLPGICRLQFDAVAGGQRYFEIKPRIESFLAGFFGWFVGQAIESAEKECGGAFSVEPVEEAVAQQKLHGLRLSDWP